jgi:hypothetical protein
VQLAISHCCQRSLRSVLFWGLFALPYLAYAQGYYGSYYQPSKTKPFDTKLASGHGQSTYMNPTRDLYNKYYYHRPSVSPYLNLDRPTVGGTTAYHTWVRPEQQRRQQQAQRQSAHIAARKQQPGFSGIGYGAAGRPNLGATPKPRPNAYYNQWYGGSHVRR